MVIATDWNNAPITATSGIFTIIAPTSVTVTAQGQDGGVKENIERTVSVAISPRCSICGLPAGIYHIKIKTNARWVIASIPYGITFGNLPEISLSINKGYSPEKIEIGTTACKVRC